MTTDFSADVLGEECIKILRKQRALIYSILTIQAVRGYMEGLRNPSVDVGVRLSLNRQVCQRLDDVKLKMDAPHKER